MDVIASWGSEEINRITMGGNEVDSVIENIIKNNKSILPILLIIHAYGHELSFPIGVNNSFLQIAKESGLPPYVMALGKRNEQGYEIFYLEGQHHTEIPKRFILPIEKIIELVKEYIKDKQLSLSIEWEDI
jgi:hypothetical protein